MGSGQSTTVIVPAYRESSNERKNREPAISSIDLQRALERQWPTSEQEIKNNILNEKRIETTALASSQNDVHPSTGQQQKPSTAGLKKVHGVLENTSVERQRTPYSYNQNDLPSPTTSNSDSLYPNLRDAYSASPQENNNMGSPVNQPYGAGPKIYSTPPGNNNMGSPVNQPHGAGPKMYSTPQGNNYMGSPVNQPHGAGPKLYSAPQGNNNMGSPVNQPHGAAPKMYSTPQGNNYMGSPVNQPHGAGPKMYSAPQGNNNMGSPVNQPHGAGPKMYSAPQGNNNMGSPVHQPHGAGPKLYSAHQGNNNVGSPVNRPYGPGFGPKVYTNSSYKNNPILQSSRSRSQSRLRGEDNEVNCETCGQRIYQCNQRHSSCEVCKARQMACGACMLQITGRSNSDLEKYFIERKVRCPNSRDGCQLFIKMGDMAIHEKKCPFQALQCPSLGSNCNWKGKLSQLAGHFKEMHPLHNQGEVDKEMFMSNVINNSHTMHYVQIGPFNFLFHVKVSEPDARVYMAAQLIGTKHSAAKWAYEIHIYDKYEPRRKYQCVERCSSANQSLQKLISSTQCAVIPQDYVKTFICGGTVAYKFYIKRDDPKAHETGSGNTARDDSCDPQQRQHFKKFAKKH